MSPKPDQKFSKMLVGFLSSDTVKRMWMTTFVKKKFSLDNGTPNVS